MLELNLQKLLINSENRKINSKRDVNEMINTVWTMDNAIHLWYYTLIYSFRKISHSLSSHNTLAMQAFVSWAHNICRVNCLFRFFCHKNTNTYSRENVTGRPLHISHNLLKFHKLTVKKYISNMWGIYRFFFGSYWLDRSMFGEHIFYSNYGRLIHRDIELKLSLKCWYRIKSRFKRETHL